MELNKSFVRGGWEELKQLSNDKVYKHYSFDFWNTIAYSNPTFKIERTKFLFQLSKEKITKEVINEAFTVVGQNYNKSIESGGKTLTIDELYLQVLDKIGLFESCDINVIKSHVFQLFLKFPPIVSQDFIKLLETLGNINVTISITSNTTFIPGIVVEEFLKQIGIFDKFSFCIFSDSELAAKPNVVIFNNMITKINSSSLTTSDIIHIGDNYVTDFIGAKKANLEAFHLLDESGLSNPRHSLHVIYDSEIIPFSTSEYSRFKFGDYSIAEKYGYELFEYFKGNHLLNLINAGKKFIIYSSPYVQIPTSSFYLTQAFIESFQKYLYSNDISGVNIEFGKIKRCQTYTEDYGAMTAEQRFNLIKNDTYELEHIPNKNDICIFIDDVSITGTHQKVIEQLIIDNQIEAHSIFLYYAKLNNPNICPSFENKLNYAFMNDINKLIEIICSASFRITTRTTKKVLSLKKDNLNELVNRLIEIKGYDLLENFVIMSYANEYNTIELFKKNLETLENYLQELKTKTVVNNPTSVWNN